MEKSLNLDIRVLGMTLLRLSNEGYDVSIIQLDNGTHLVTVQHTKVESDRHTVYGSTLVEAFHVLNSKMFD